MRGALAAAALLVACAGEGVRPGLTAETLAGEWTVTAIAGEPALSDAPATVTFGPDGRVSGTTGCNHFGGSYTVEDGELRLGPLAITKMMCPSPQTKQEASVLDVLNAVRGASVDGNLVLTGTNGTLVAERP